MEAVFVTSSSWPTHATSGNAALPELLESMGLELLFFIVAIVIAFALRGLRKRTIGSVQSLAKAKKKLQVQHSPPPSGRSAPKSTTNEAGPKPCMTLEDFVDRTINTRLQTTAAITYYCDLKLTDGHLRLSESLAKAGSKHSALDFFSAMIQCAGRAGRPQLVLEILDDVLKIGLACPLAMYESAMKLLAAKKCFHQALEVYDRLERNGLVPSPVTFSCLVSFAAEVGESDRAIVFFNRLATQQPPSIRAYMTVLRIYSQRKDWVSSRELLASMHQCGAELDSLALNMTLSTGVVASEVEAAAKMLDEEPWTSLADVVSHNIILKGLAQKGKVAKALFVLNAMPERKVAANHISYNTVIDAAVRGQQVEIAWTVYNAMRYSAGLPPDKCTASTMVKALQLDPSWDRVKSIGELLQATLAECPADLAARLFASTISVAVRLKDLPLAMHIFRTMRLIPSEAPALAHAAAALPDLALLAARHGDHVSCTMVWKHVLPDSPELRIAKASVSRELANSGDICATTIRCLGQCEARMTAVAPTWRKLGQRVP